MTDTDTQRDERKRFRDLVEKEIAFFAQYAPDANVQAADIHHALLRIKNGINPDKPRSNKQRQ